MRGSAWGDPARSLRHRYIIEDPVRLLCLVSAAALLVVGDLPFWLTLSIVSVSQLAPVLMVWRTMEEGWSRRWGSKIHPAVFASSLSMDFSRLSACTIVGAMLLVRHFNGAEVIRPLAVLAAAVCFLPDIRLCRWLLADEPVKASRLLRESYALRDPVMLGTALAVTVACGLDRTSLRFVMYSMVFLQLNAILVLLDKYLPEIEVRRWPGTAGLLLEREGRRFWLCVSPLAIVPLRLYGGDRLAYGAAVLVGAAIVIPDLVRMAVAIGRALALMFRVAPAPRPATYVVLPKSH
jgi:hypothetical protein